MRNKVIVFKVYGPKLMKFELLEAHCTLLQ